MQTQTIQYYCAMNPLIGLSPNALRLYSALEVFREAYPSETDRDWFRVPDRAQRLRQIGMSMTKIDKGVAELVNAGLLQMRVEQNTRWYRLN